MNDDLHRMVGEVGGKVDTLTTLVRDYIEAHDKRHEKIDEQVSQAHADINQAKGRRGVLVTLAGLVGGLVVALIDRLLKGG